MNYQRFATWGCALPGAFPHAEGQRGCPNTCSLEWRVAVGAALIQRWRLKQIHQQLRLISRGLGGVVCSTVDSGIALEADSVPRVKQLGEFAGTHGKLDPGDVHRCAP